MDEGITNDDAETKSTRQIQFSDLESETKHPFMRFWAIKSYLGQERVCAESEGHPV